MNPRGNAPSVKSNTAPLRWLAVAAGVTALGGLLAYIAFMLD